MSIDDATEAERLLLDHAHGQFGKLDVAELVALVLRATAGLDFTVQRAALDAAARRYAAAARDELRVLGKPGDAVPFWRVGRRNGAAYDVEILSRSPLRASCSCADFVRSSLGICKHVFVVLGALPKRWQPPKKGRARSRLSWDVVHAPTEDADRLRRLRVEGAMAVPGLVSGRARERTLREAPARHALLVELDRRVRSGRLRAEPAAARVVSEELARSESALACDGGHGSADRALSGLSRKLYGYQREAVLAFLRRGALLLADDMGLGKTTQAVAACHALLKGDVVKRLLIVAPASLKPQWAREWRATTDEPVIVVDGNPEQRATTYASTHRSALIIGYEQLLRDIDFVRVWGPEVVVLDEAQRIKNWATKSATIVKTLKPRYRLALTGTPMENRLDELASIVDFVDDLALEPKWRLTPLHTFSDGDAGAGRSGVRNLDLLRERLRPVMVRRHRSEVLTQLPERTDTRVPLELTPQQREEHDALYQPIARLVSITAKRPLRQEEFLRLMQLFTQQRMIANGLAQVGFDEMWPELSRRAADDATLATLFSPKLGALRDLLRDLVVEQDRKVVVFSQWRAMVRLGEWAVREVLRGGGKRAGFFTGAESPKLREKAIQEFHDDPAMSVLFLTDAGGTGLNLQRAASACVQLELPWNPAVLEQRISRIHRPGQRRPIDVFHLVSEDSIESRIAGLVAQKRAVFEALFDGTSNEVMFDKNTSFLSQMRALYEDLDRAAPTALATSEDSEVDASSEAAGGDELDALDELGATELDVRPAEPSIEPAWPAGPTAPAPGPFRVVRSPSGGLTIDVPAEHAAALSTLLSSLADALRSSST